MSKSTSSRTVRLVRAGLATAAATAVIVAGAPAPAMAASVAVTLSTAAGSSSGGNTITASSTAAAAFLAGSTAPVATFSMPVCAVTYTSVASTAVTPSSLTVGNVLVVTTNKVSNSKASILVPALLVVPVATATSAKYNLCIYASATAGSALVGNSTYTVAVAPGILTGAVVPGSGPALGGSTIVVTGTAFPTTAGSITGTLGGQPLTSVTPLNATSFSAVTPAHGPGTVTLTMTTAAGTQTLTGAYIYANGISVSPNTAPKESTSVFVDVTGAGFANLVFPTARVFLVDGKYNAGVAAATAYASAAGSPVAECTGAVVISDNELICSLNLFTGFLTPLTGVAANTVVPDGAYTMTVVSDGAFATNTVAAVAAGFTQTDISSGSTFTVGPY